MEKIESLTEKQEAEFVKFREKWLKIGLSTGPVDIESATPVINNFYARIGKKAPFIWRVGSPLSANIVIHILKTLDGPTTNLGANLADNLWANLGANLWANLWANLGANLGANLRDNLGANLADNLWANLADNLRANLRDNLGANLADNLADNLRANLADNLGANLGANLADNLWANLADNLGANLWANLGANLWANLADNLRDNLGANLADNLRANLRANLRDNLADNLRANLADNLRASLADNLRANLWANLRDNLRANLRDNLPIPCYTWGSLDSYWIAYYLFPHEHIRGMHTQDQLGLLREWAVLAESVFWWYPFQGICFVCDRPDEIHKDELGRLHNDNGPSVSFNDGWKLYHSHGIEIPGWIVTHPDTITPDVIQAEKNSEVRRIMMRKFGWGNFMEYTQAELIHSDGFGDLFRWREPDGIEVRVVKVINGTPEPDGSYKDYWLRVPIELNTALDAVAWTYSLSPQQVVNMPRT